MQICETTNLFFREAGGACSGVASSTIEISSREGKGEQKEQKKFLILVTRQCPGNSLSDLLVRLQPGNNDYAISSLLSLSPIRRPPSPLRRLIDNPFSGWVLRGFAERKIGKPFRMTRCSPPWKKWKKNRNSTSNRMDKVGNAGETISHSFNGFFILGDHHLEF